MQLVGPAPRAWKLSANTSGSSVEYSRQPWAKTSGTRTRHRSPGAYSASTCLVGSSTGGCQRPRASRPVNSASTPSVANVLARTSTSSSTSRRIVGQYGSTAPSQEAAYASASAAQAASGSFRWGCRKGASAMPG
ncbi:hypothetical protein J3A78_003461 [Streptomyces sp. PvR006]|uniref:hypothetical protein n=1 Tax=Streptomyces sp. PvR006 TaxID=2817860 RepID=UPI001AEA4F30|nr:hypothetical protein [Streptomyces sp. PvR006]MBP2582983.1 hypothetical protein [Streptomyces sp. PvR006]